MEKIDCIEEYYSSVKAYYLFLMGNAFKNEEWQKYILNDNYLNGAKVYFISNLFLDIKEDLVSKVGFKSFESNIMYNQLDNTVEIIANKIDKGYKLNKKEFASSADVIAFLRNKFAHGKYVIDFDHNRVVFDDNGSNVIVNINKLMLFTITAVFDYLKYQKRFELSRNVFIYTDKNKKEKKINTTSELRNVIKKIKLVKFKLKSDNDKEISLVCLKRLDNFIKYYSENYNNALKSNLYKELKSLLKENNVSLTIEEKRLKKQEDINTIEEFFKTEVMNNNEFDFNKEIEIIGRKIEIILANEDYLNVTSGIKHLILLDAISNKRLSNLDALKNYLYTNSDITLNLLYEDIGVSYLSMLNTLFSYPFDDIYNGANDYKKITSDDFDFSKLDLSLIDVSKIDIFSNTINEKEVICNGLLKRKEQTEKNIEQQKKNLKELKNKSKDTTNLEAIIGNMKKTLKQQNKSLKAELESYNEMKEYFNNNYNYFRNKRIVEGIRNSIAHGNYKFITKKNSLDTLIEFSDIYEDKLTFRGTITFRDLETLLDDNFSIIQDFINKDKKETVVAKR